MDTDPLALLFRDSAPLFAIVDGARRKSFAAELSCLNLPGQSLYAGDAAEDLGDAGPYLVEIPRYDPIWATWARETWGTRVATYLTCTLPFAEVRQHLRKFLIVELEPGGTAFFRFYDPRVLQLFLPTCREDEWTTFFGPIDAFLVARADDLALLRYRRTAHGCAAELMHP